MSNLPVFPFLNSLHAENRLSKLIIFSKILWPLTPPPQQVIILTNRLCGIYKLFHEYLKLFPKEEKFSLGVKIESVILEILSYTISASYKPKHNKRELLIKASDSADILKILVRLTHETGSLNKQKYLTIEEKLIEVGKMIGGWLKSTTEWSWTATAQSRAVAAWLWSYDRDLEKALEQRLFCWCDDTTRGRAAMLLLRLSCQL